MIARAWLFLLCTFIEGAARFLFTILFACLLAAHTRAVHAYVHKHAYRHGHGYEYACICIYTYCHYCEI